MKPLDSTLRPKHFRTSCSETCVEAANITSQTFLSATYFSRSRPFIFNIKGVFRLFPACHILLARLDLPGSIFVSHTPKNVEDWFVSWHALFWILGGCQRQPCRLLKDLAGNPGHATFPLTHCDLGLSSQRLWV